MAGGSEWSRYTPRQRARRAKAQAERCRAMNLARSKEMRTRIAREMGKKNKGRKPSPKIQDWKKDPVKMAAHREKQRRITLKQYKTDPILSEQRKEGGRRKLRELRQDKVLAEDWWARNHKLSKQRKRIEDTRRRLATIGLDIVPTERNNVSQAYLDEIDEFFAEVI